MTTIITRLYADTRTAEKVVDELKAGDIPARGIDLIADAGEHGSVKARMVDAHVPEDSAAKYAPHVEGGNALVVVRAEFTPVGAARAAKKIVNAHPSIDAGVEDEDYYITKAMPKEHAPSILKDHPRFLSGDMDPGKPRRGLISPIFGLPLLTRHRKRRSVMEDHRHVSTRILPMDLVTRHPRKPSVMQGGYKFSEALGLPTVTPRNR